MSAANHTGVPKSPHRQEPAVLKEPPFVGVAQQRRGQFNVMSGCPSPSHEGAEGVSLISEFNEGIPPIPERLFQIK